VSIWAHLTIALLELLIGGVLGVLLTLWWADRHGREADDQHPELDQPSNATAELVDTANRTSAVFGRALSAHTSLRARLAGVAASAEEHAQTLEHLHKAGIAPKGIRANADWRAPPELSRDLPRPGSQKSWQALDRSFEALLAVLDDPDANYAHHARAYAKVGQASRQISDELAGASTLELAAGCSFCAKGRTQVTRLIAGPGIYICDECIALCVDIMEEESGPDWHEETNKRLQDSEDQT